tara:strand:+ start:570 stop:959 length:390 start_codon:yes stop_codon:yes gene_type:complete
MDIKCLNDLNSFRSAPQLSKIQKEKLLVELELNILESDWVTIGIMAENDKAAIKALSSISEKYSNIKFRDLNSLSADGSVFLKGNQKTGNVFIRSESGLGEGILLTCQYEDAAFKSFTYGPFPLDFFTN